MKMEQLKSPAMILSIANTLGLLGVAAYGHRKLSVMEEELKAVKEALTGSLKRVNELTVTSSQLTELATSVKQIDATIRNKDNELNRLSKKTRYTADDIQQIQDFLGSLVKSLKDGGLDIKVEEKKEEPSPFGRQKRVADRRGKRTTRRDERDDDSDESSDEDQIIDDYRRRTRH
jgi:septal ring factor EnvC (AmiA/AmiB activator)